MRPINTKVVAADRVEELRTSRGTARAHVFTVAHGVSRAALILGHGRTSGIDSPDLATLAQQLPALGIEVVLLEQPWRVAGANRETDPHALDTAWIESVKILRQGGIGLRRMVLGGHGEGARIACRTVEQTSPVSMLLLGFPLFRGSDGEADSSAELAMAARVVPVTVVQGTDDKTGEPADIAAAAAEHGCRVLVVALPMVGHSFRLQNRATITDAEARLILVESARNSVLPSAGNRAPLLAR